MKPQPSRSLRLAQCFTLLFTNVVKIVGLIFAIEQLLKDQPTPATLAFAAFMIAGGQVSEGLILTLLDRLLGANEKPKPPPSAP
jgi:hypothetical protein